MPHGYGELKVFSGSAHPELAEDICKMLGVPLGKRKTVRFSNENMLIQIDENVRGADVFVIQPSCSPVSDGIVELLIMIDALKHASAGRITAVVPYWPYVRSDKKDQPRISIAARLMADLVQTAGADRVLTMDLHAAQIQGFFRIPADHLKAIGILCAYLKDFLQRFPGDRVLVAADAGHAKESGPYANRLELPIAIIDKRRIGNEDRVKPVNLIGDVRGKIALIVDDEIATGGTLIEGAKFLIERGAVAVEAAAVHGILSGNAPAILLESPIRSIVVTNTVPVPDSKRIGKLNVISVAHLFADAIKAIHGGSSISDLFV